MFLHNCSQCNYNFLFGSFHLNIYVRYFRYFYNLDTFSFLIGIRYLTEES